MRKQGGDGDSHPEKEAILHRESNRGRYQRISTGKTYYVLCNYKSSGNASMASLGSIVPRCFHLYCMYLGNIHSHVCITSYVCVKRRCSQNLCLFLRPQECLIMKLQCLVSTIRLSTVYLGRRRKIHIACCYLAYCTTVSECLNV